MMTEIQKLEKLIKTQDEQIKSLKKAMSGLQIQINLLSKKTDRTYHQGKKNANDINNVSNILRTGFSNTSRNKR